MNFILDRRIVSCPEKECRIEVNVQEFERTVGKENFVNFFGFDISEIIGNKSDEHETAGVNCMFCNFESNELTGKILYFKCPKCSHITCQEHKILMKNCLCLCPRCLSGLVSVNDKRDKCKKCDVEFCLDCKKEIKFNINCDCYCSLCGKSTSESDLRKCRNCLSTCENCFIQFSITNMIFCNRCSKYSCRYCNYSLDVKHYQINEVSCILCFESWYIF